MPTNPPNVMLYTSMTTQVSRSRSTAQYLRGSTASATAAPSTGSNSCPAFPCPNSPPFTNSTRVATLNNDTTKPANARVPLPLLTLRSSAQTITAAAVGATTGSTAAVACCQPKCCARVGNTKPSTTAPILPAAASPKTKPCTLGG